MQHIIFGAGLIGGYLYGALQSQGESVSMVARPEVAAKLGDGLQLSDYQGHQHVIEQVQFADLEQASSCDYLWLTVKCTAVVEALEGIIPLLHDDTVIFCCQNGLGSADLVQQRLPGHRVLHVMVMFNVVELGSGKLHRGSQGRLFLESDAEEIAALADKLNCDLLPTVATRDIHPVLWAKLQLNLANAVSALADLPVKAMLEQRAYRLCIALLMRELIAVARAKHIRIARLTPLPAHWFPFLLHAPDAPFRLVTGKILTIDPTVRTSMWWDIHNQRLTEVDYLNGAVVAEAECLGLSCPANSRIVAMVHELERNERSGGISADQLYRELSAM